jgi:hypothetical protein
VTATHPLRIIEQSGQRYLVNASDRPVSRLVCSVGYCFIDWDGGTLLDPTVARFALHDVPAHCHVAIAAAERPDAGIVWWQADEIEWADGQLEGNVELPAEGFWDESPLPGQRVERTAKSIAAAALAAS